MPQTRNDCNAIIETESNTLIAGCKSTVIPSSALVIGESAFTQCVKLTSITIPKGVTKIEKDAFSSCIGLMSIVIPSGLTLIGEYAFQDCTNLAGVVLGKDVVTIGSFAFYRCGLQAVMCKATNPPTLGNTVFGITAIPLYVPTSSVPAYGMVSQWNAFVIYAQDFSGLKDAPTAKNVAKQIFDVMGRSYNSLQHGVNIVRYGDGSIKKEIMQ